MIHFAPIRTRRLSIRLKEISIGEAVKLCSMSLDRYEATASEFLRMVLDEARCPSELHVADPRAWTVQERMWAISSYLCVMQDGDFNFKVGDNAHFTDYLVPNTDYPVKAADLGEIGGDQWTMRPLLGAEAEAIEITQYERGSGSGRLHWISGAMAAQLRRKTEAAAPNALKDFTGYTAWLKERMAVIEKFPESSFTELLRQFWIGQDRLTHFFRIGFDESGVVSLPGGKEAGEAIRPARFHAAPCVSDIARNLCGKPNQSGR
jgi:hypothetical protein